MYSLKQEVEELRMLLKKKAVWELLQVGSQLLCTAQGSRDMKVTVFVTLKVKQKSEGLRGKSEYFHRRLVLVLETIRPSKNFVMPYPDRLLNFEKSGQLFFSFFFFLLFLFLKTIIFKIFDV